jgi:CubicO group peptidase (beta-lactamase class C family)
MRRFFQQNFAQQSLAGISMEQRIERYHQMRSRAGSLTLKRVLDNADDRTRILVASKDGFMLRMEFQCEPDPPLGLVSIAIAQARPEDEGINPMKDDASLIAAVAEYLDTLAKEDKFSGVVLIAKGGTPIFQKAYGLADREKNIPNTLNTRFNLGSMNKSFTAVAIHQLASHGKLSFSDRIGTFLPHYPNKEASETVTVQQLLDMTSGIGDFFNERYDATPKQKLNSINGYLPLFADLPLAFAPGSRRQYSNGGYIVLGAIIEAVSGVDYYTYVRKNLFLPAGMTSTDSYEEDARLPDIAVGYTVHEENGSATVRKSNFDRLPQRGSSAGGGYSTVSDLLKYTKELSDSTIVPTSYEGRNGMGIAGGMEGVNAALDWLPKKGYAIIVLSNYDPPTAENAAQRIRAWLP